MLLPLIPQLSAQNAMAAVVLAMELTQIIA